MKILITYALTGAGHLKAAEAISKCLREKYPDVQVELIDFLEKTNAFFRFFYSGGYSFLIRRSLLLWRFFFWWTDFEPTSFIARPLGAVLNRWHSKRFIRFLVDKQFDCIVSTHFFSAEIAGFLKRKKKIRSRLVTVVTDFGAHRFWVSSGTDIYIAATELTKLELGKKGAHPDNVRVLGIPVDPSFSKAFDLVLLRKKFGADKGLFTVLIIAGSFGIGPIKKLVDLLCEDLQILVVCAKNKRLFNSLKRRDYAGVRVFGFVDNIAELMSVSDCIITKPGGLTIAESLDKDLAPVFMTAIPGQEMQNIKVLAQYGIGLYSKKAARLRDMIMDLKSHPEKIRLLKENAAKIKKPRALEEICHVICEDRPGGSC